MNRSRLIEVYRCTHKLHGELAMGLLNAEGLVAFLDGDDMASSIANAGAPTNATFVRVFVREEDADLAIAILSERSTAP